MKKESRNVENRRKFILTFSFQRKDGLLITSILAEERTIVLKKEQLFFIFILFLLDQNVRRTQGERGCAEINNVQTNITKQYKILWL